MKAGLATSLSIAGVLATGGAALVLNSSILDTESSAKGSPAFATVVGLEAQGGITPLGDGAAPGSVTDLSAAGIADVIDGEPLVVTESGLVDASSGATPSGAAGTDTESATGGSKSKTSGIVKQKQTILNATEVTVAPTPTTVAPAPTPSTTAPTPPPTTVPVVEKQFQVGDAATITLTVNGTKLLVKEIAITPGSGYKVTSQTSRDGDDVRITLTSPTRVLEFSARVVNGQVVAAVSAPSSGNLTPPPPRHDDDDDHEEREHEHEEHEREHEDDDD